MLLFALPLRAQTQDAPLPAMAELRARAVRSYGQSAVERERYICRERLQNQELDGSGAVRKTQVLEREIFYVNGFQIAQTLAKDGKPLDAGELKKQDEQVRKAIQDASRHVKPRDPGLVISAGDILKEGKLANERRVLVAGRPTIVFDVQPDPHATTTTTEEKLVADMEGTVSIDEATGNLQDVNTRGVHGVRVGGGLVANVHRGFALHVLVAPQTVGNVASAVWLLKLAEGSGDARIGLLVHSGMRFRQETEGCKLYTIDTVQSGDKVKTTPPK